MRRQAVRTFSLVLLAASVLAAPAFEAQASSALRGIMKTWKRDWRSSTSMISGRGTLDQEALRTTLARYVADSGSIAAQINGQSADARDMKQRFLTFQQTAQAALQHVGDKQALQSDFKRMDATCNACHDLYKD